MPAKATTKRKTKRRAAKRPIVLESLGHLCASLRAPYAVIAAAVQDAGIRPAYIINGVHHFDGQQAGRIAVAVREAFARDAATPKLGRATR